LNGIEAFLPGSQVDSRPIRNLNSFIGQDLEAKVIKFSRKRNNIVLSRKILTDEVVKKQNPETLGQIEEGFVIEGTIKNLTEYGAFVDIGGIDGLLHVTDMSWGRLQNPGDQFKVNETVQVKVLKLDREKEKVALGYKQLIPDPWSTVMEIYPINGKIKGRVSSVTDYGAFIELEPGVEGLVHVSEMSWSKRSASPRKLLNYGQEIEVQVLGIDTDDRRISLGMKQLQPNPWQTIHERYSVGQTIKGKIRNLTEFGAFVEVEDGIDGLVHVSDISHSKKIKHPKDVLRRDQEVEAVIRNIDTENRRMSLSIKDLTPSAWDAFTAAHRPGAVIRGKISRFTGFGAFVDLGNEIEGLCHISEFSDQRVERPEDLGPIGQEMDFRILRIEQDTQKIGLSARAVGKTDEPYVDAKSYSTEAKGGMASLGELMNLKRGGESEDVKQEPRLSKKERRAVQAKQRAEQHEAQLAQAAERNARPETTEATDDASADIESSETAAADAPTNSEEAQSAENSVNQTPDSDDGQTADNTEATADESDAQPASEPETAAETISEETNEIPATEAIAEESGEVTSTEPVAEKSTETPAAETVVEPETAAEPVAEEPSETTAAETAVESETVAEPVAEESAEKSSETTSDKAVAEESSEAATSEAAATDDDLLELGETHENRVENAETEDLLETETSSAGANVEEKSGEIDSAVETAQTEEAAKSEAADNSETVNDSEEQTAKG
ncbi:MAG: S1 RNA-binding domain-containing protein, partial [Pyrinomonadaceae bacterium]|nr:S1 RNA-binding domain-containing protein [Pyrinomonadaceae bacterium]